LSSVAVTYSYKEQVTETIEGVTRSNIVVTPSGFYPNQTYHLEKFSRSTAIRTGFTRQIPGVLPLPSVMPKLNFRMGAKQFADSVALIRQFLAGKRLLS
jgi:hypothetical protein